MKDTTMLSPHVQIRKAKTKTAKAFAMELFSSAPPEAHPLVVAMNEGTLPLDQARHVALAIGDVVACFPRFLAAVIANIEDHRDRMELVENLYQEHGAMNPDKVHLVTYHGFLGTLGITDDEIASHTPGTSALSYNRAVMSLCRDQPVAEALGALGVIEEIVARVSLAVSRYAALVVNEAKSEEHFSLHQTLDLEHADEIYALCEPHFVRDPDAVTRGMRLGHRYHLGLYCDVLADARADG